MLPRKGVEPIVFQYFSFTFFHSYFIKALDPFLFTYRNFLQVVPPEVENFERSEVNNLYRNIFSYIAQPFYRFIVEEI